MTEQEIEKTQYFPLKLAYPFGHVDQKHGDRVGPDLYHIG